MPRSVYGLFYRDPTNGEKKYFYVGRSVDTGRRMKQHGYAKSTGSEDKYAMIRDLERRGIGWELETLREIQEGEYPPDNERWYVIQLTRDGHALTNMRHGSIEHRQELAEQVRNPSIRNIADVCADRAKRKFASSRHLRLRILKKALKSEGIPDVAADKLLPPVLRRRMLSKGYTKWEPGYTLSEIIQFFRLNPRLAALMERFFPSHRVPLPAQDEAPLPN